VPGQHIGLQTDSAQSLYESLGFSPQPEFMSLVVGTGWTTRPTATDSDYGCRFDIHLIVSGLDKGGLTTSSGAGGVMPPAGHPGAGRAAHALEVFDSTE
jgi:hypothetical protein